MPDSMPQQLGNYHLIRSIGQGGFANVYLCQHTHTQTLAAIKVLQTRLVGEDQQRFYNEALTIARLNHPNIVHVLDFGVDGNTPYLVTDYAPAGTLRQLYPRGARAPLHLIVGHVWQVASALQYAHNQHTIHRDVKPENMLIGQNGEILLTDFGIALVTQSSRYQTTQEVVGTVLYMAPEQLQGKPRPASDQYALGIVAYEWITGDRPFHGSFAEVASQHLFAPPPSIRQKAPHISPHVEQVVMTALAKDPQQRFASIQAFADAFEQALTETQRISSSGQQFTPVMPIVATNEYARPFIATPPFEPPSASAAHVTPSRTWGQRLVSRRSLLAGLVALGAVAGGIALLVHAEQSINSKGVGNDLFVYSGQSGQIYIVSWSPDGTRIASGANDNTVAVWAATTGFNLFPPYRGHKSAVYALAWSPNGQYIASGGNDNTVQVWNATNGSPILTYTGHTGSVNAIAWSPDSATIASASADNSVQVWGAMSKSVLFNYKHNSLARSVAWSPNGQYIVSGGDDSLALVYNAANGNRVNSYSGHSSRIWTVAWSPDNTRIVSASDDRTAQVWNATSGTRYVTYTGHTDSVTTVDWSSTAIASGSSDTTVQIWDAATGNRSYTYTRHSDGVSAVRWSPKQPDVASASKDATVRVWQAR